MYIESLEISNYKSFNKPQLLQLSRGINIVIGKNNVGKTTFLDALTFFVNNPHKGSIKANSSHLRASTIRATLGFTKDEIEGYIIDQCNGDFYLDTEVSYPFYFQRDSQRPENWDVTDFTHSNESYTNHPGPYSFEEKIKFFFTKELFSLSLNTNGEKKQFKLNELHKSFVDETIRECYQFRISENSLSFIGTQNNVSDTFVKLADSLIKSLVYKFEVYRTVGSSSPITGNNILSSDCSNLPSVLLFFQADSPGFNAYKEAVKEIFPEISDIIVHPNDSNFAQIGIWNQGPIKNRTDLAIPLKDCGTGIGQVLAILYLVISSTSPQVIIIDEPNSFLHPSASRKLINIFKRYPQHQYIISTHSPEIIASNPDNLILLTLEEGETRVKVLETKQKQDIQYAMQEIGLKLSDVYGYDKILWVEGPTEQVCFPKIISKLYPGLAINIAVEHVRNTGNFEKQYLETTIKLYQKLSGGDSYLIPPAIAYIFDKEGKKQQDIDDLARIGKKASKTKDVDIVHFIKPRLYENFILDNDAIAFSLNEYSSHYGLGENYSPEKINTWVESNKSNLKYWDKGKQDQADSAEWKENIHAAKLLEDLFGEFTDHKVSYQKTVDSVKLTEYLLENKPEAFDSLKQLLDKFLLK